MQRLLREAVIRQCPPFIPRSVFVPRLLYRRHNVAIQSIQRKNFHLPTLLVPPIVFGGLVVVLWTWKCLMMVIFQNKIIYMPGLPPNARREKIDDYKNQCCGIGWNQNSIRSLDGTKISLCVASVTNGEALKHVHILYFQGNASSTPPRLPFLSPVLRCLKENSANVRYAMTCVSYRGFWTSGGRPFERGIALDALAALNNIKDADEIIIWGQSIGAGVASNLAAQSPVPISLLILETPFISVRAMLETLYPQKWLPYKHLWPFLRNHLDSYKALGMMPKKLKVLILDAGKDELVPREHGNVLEKRCKEFGLEVTRNIVGGAFHTEVLMKPEGRMAVVHAILAIRAA